MYVSVYKEKGLSPLLQDASILKHTHTHTPHAGTATIFRSSIIETSKFKKWSSSQVKQVPDEKCLTRSIIPLIVSFHPYIKP